MAHREDMEIVVPPHTPCWTSRARSGKRRSDWSRRDIHYKMRFTIDPVQDMSVRPLVGIVLTQHEDRSSVLASVVEGRTLVIPVGTRYRARRRERDPQASESASEWVACQTRRPLRFTLSPAWLDSFALSGGGDDDELCGL
jgi:hypothetical protein